MKKALQNTTQNNSVSLIEVKNGVPDTISVWVEAYFRFEVTTSESSRKEQRRDLSLFRDFMIEACGSDGRHLWTPRVSQALKEHLKKRTVCAEEKGGHTHRITNQELADVLEDR